MTIKFSDEELKKIAHELISDILAFKNYGRIEKFYCDGRNEFRQNIQLHRTFVLLKCKGNVFQWNEDHDYCERHYDAFGVIDNCPLFEEWENFAKELVKKKEKETGTRIEMELEGIKYDLTLDVTVYPS
jgi:hypothetical protein